jgi:hypothetical protein|eukprot:2683348-Prymnesium_polylepis.1
MATGPLAPVDVTLPPYGVYSASDGAAGEGRARALVVETSTPAAGDRSVYPVGRSPGQGASSGAAAVLGAIPGHL